jgi:hypothetical protein
LRKLGVDMVKIDGAFVEDLIRSKDDRAFVHADRSCSPSRPRHRRRAHRQDPRRLGLRIFAGRTHRTRLARAALARRQGRGRCDPHNRHGRICSLVPAIHVFLRSPHKDVDAREQARA